VTALLVMAKAPRAGTVNTRLHPLLGPAGSAALQRALLEHTCALAAGSGLATFVAYDPPDAAPEVAALVPPGVRLLPQGPGELGQRTGAASGQVAGTAPGPVLVIGVDAPTLTASLLVRAATVLDAARGRAARDPGADADCAADVVLGPALDGGYYLIGLRRPQPSVFALDPGRWGGDQVRTDTLARLRAAGLRAHLLPVLRDLDTPDDAAALLADPGLPPAVAARLRPPALLR